MVAPISAFGGNPFTGMGNVSSVGNFNGSAFAPGLNGAQFMNHFNAPGFNLPNFQIQGGINAQPASMAVSPLTPAQNTQGSFLDTLRNTLQNANSTLQKPDQLLNDAVLGGKADVHDVMIANAQAELTVNIAAQGTTKLVQAYDKITQIQV
jgi:flagellar hook-basal body complex protein FliE